MMFSDNSDDEFSGNDFYHRKYRLLLEKCEAIQQSNEMVVHRLLRMKKMLRRVRKQRLFLINWLDRYHDDWRTTDYPLDIGIDEKNSYVDLIEQEYVERIPLRTTNESSSGILPTTTGVTDSDASDQHRVKNTTRRRREGKAEKDPNAPKRPANPYFQYCQEQRPIVLDYMLTSGIREPSKQDLTKQLAYNWKVLSRKDKKVYYDKYTRSKEQYIANMQQYATNKARLELEPST